MEPEWKSVQTYICKIFPSPAYTRGFCSRYSSKEILLHRSIQKIGRFESSANASWRTLEFTLANEYVKPSGVPERGQTHSSYTADRLTEIFHRQKLWKYRNANDAYVTIFRRRNKFKFHRLIAFPKIRICIKLTSFHGSDLLALTLWITVNDITLCTNYVG